jgi:nucleoside-diphosphate kinase
MVKPDAIRRDLVGEVISRFEGKQFGFVHMRLHCLSEEEAEKLYAEHKGKEFYEGLIKFTVSGPVVIMVLSREDAIGEARRLIARVRNELADTGPRNLVHASDSRIAFLHEYAIFFPEVVPSEPFEG